MYPESIMKKLRQREGLEITNKSQDETLQKLNPHEALREVCAWELGHGDWANTFISWAENCGFTVEVKQ